MSEPDIYKLLGRNIATQRRQRALTQAQVAEHVGLTRASLANIETGRQRAMLHHIYEIAEALGMASITELIPEYRPESLAPAQPDRQGRTQGRAAMKFTGEMLTAIEKAQVETVIKQALGAKPRRSR